MTPLISWVCRVDHAVPERSEYEPMVTLNDGRWAYCIAGGNSDHEWDAIKPAPVEMLRFRRHVVETPAVASAQARPLP